MKIMFREEHGAHSRCGGIMSRATPAEREWMVFEKVGCKQRFRHTHTHTHTHTQLNTTFQTQIF